MVDESQLRCQQKLTDKCEKFKSNEIKNSVIEKCENIIS